MDKNKSTLFPNCILLSFECTNSFILLFYFNATTKRSRLKITFFILLFNVFCNVILHFTYSTSCTLSVIVFSFYNHIKLVNVNSRRLDCTLRVNMAGGASTCNLFHVYRNDIYLSTEYLAKQFSKAF